MSCAPRGAGQRQGLGLGLGLGPCVGEGRGVGLGGRRIRSKNLDGLDSATGRIVVSVMVDVVGFEKRCDLASVTTTHTREQCHMVIHAAALYT